MADNELLFFPSDPEIKEIANEVERMMKNDFNTTTNVTWQSLISAAKFFIQRCDELSNFSITSSQFDILKDAMGLVRKSNQELVLLQASYVYAFWFDEQLKQFRGQVPSSALYVFETRKGLSTYEIPLMSLIKYINAADKNRLGASQSQLKKELDGIKKENIFDEKHVAQAQAAYYGTLNRLERFWSKVGGQRQNGLLMWKENHSWAVANVLNKGDLKEAYTGVLMTHHQSNMDKICQVPTGSPEYYSHELISVFFNEHISKVSNAAAIKEEDIVMQNKQYAVKSFRAVLPSLNQYYEVAQWIVNNQQASLEELEKEIGKGTEGFRNKFLGLINQESNESFDNLLNKSMSQFLTTKK